MVLVAQQIGDASYRLASLTRDRSWQGRRIQRASGRLQVLDAAKAGNPQLISKINNLVAHLTHLKRKECDILSEINDIEAKHRFLRQTFRVQRVLVRSVPMASSFRRTARRKRQGGRWIFLLALAWIVWHRRNKKIYVKQALRVG